MVAVIAKVEIGEAVAAKFAKNAELRGLFLFIKLFEARAHCPVGGVAAVAAFSAEINIIKIVGAVAVLAEYFRLLHLKVEVSRFELRKAL